MRLVLSTMILAGAFMPLRAQEAFMVASDPRVPITSCPAADSILGPLSKDEQKAEVHGTLGPGHAYHLTTGPLSLTRDRASVIVTSFTPPRGLLPAGYIAGFFPSKILDQSREQAEPIMLVLADTLQIPLSTPHPTKVTGIMPLTLPFTTLLRAEDLQLFLKSTSAKLTFLGTTSKIDRSVILETQAAARLATCQLAAAPQPTQ